MLVRCVDVSRLHTVYPCMVAGGSDDQVGSCVRKLSSMLHDVFHWALGPATSIE